MPWFDVFSSPDIEAHLGHHHVTRAEFEWVLFGARKVEPNKNAGRFEVVGTTEKGRLIRCIFEYIDNVTILPVTAFDVFGE